jgi:hypothetical protein
MEREPDEKAVADELARQARTAKDGLLGDTETNRNVTGSTTWETLPDQGPAKDDEVDLPGGG